MYLQAVKHSYHLYRKEINAALTGGVISLVLTLGLIISPAASALNIGGPSDCDDNAIIRCGAHSTAALISAYNSSAYVRAVYASFGISQADISSLPSTNVAGQVTKDGNVFVDGQSRAVATNAVTGGRQDIAGSTQVNAQGAVFFRRPPSVSFQQASLPAFVAMQNGKFQFAVIASCGNAVRAVATAAPQQQTAVGQARVVSRPPAAKPTPAPAPAQAQTQSQSQQVSVNNTNTQTTNQAAPQQQPQEVAAGPAPAAPAQPATQATSSTLPNTGPTGVVGAFLAAAGLGTLGYRRFILRKLLE